MIAWLPGQGEPIIQPVFVEAMQAEWASLERLGMDEVTDVEMRYAYLIAADEPVSFDDLPACMWP